MKKTPGSLGDLIAEERRRQAINDLRTILKMPEGRRFYWRLLLQANVFGGSWAESASRTALNEGRRALGIELMQEVQRQAPAEHVLTLSEQLQLQSEDESRRRAEKAKAENENGD